MQFSFNADVLEQTTATAVGLPDIGNESVLIQLAQCWFPGLAISSAKI